MGLWLFFFWRSDVINVEDELLHAVRLIDGDGLNDILSAYYVPWVAQGEKANHKADETGHTGKSPQGNPFTPSLSSVVKERSCNKT